MDRNWTLVREAAGYGLWRCDAGWSVTGIDRARGQVTDAMPGDAPPGSGQWFAKLGPKGVDYVTRPYGAGYARRMFRDLTSGRVEAAVRARRTPRPE